jgi:polysaccharide export outer membrane protein
MRTIFMFAVIAAFLAVGPAAAQTFTLKPGDVIEVSVLEDATLNRQALVRPDGLISLPIAGTITAGGRTPEQVQAAIVSRLRSDFVTDPTVTVALVSLAPDALETEEEEEIGRIFVLGQVRAPGLFQFKAEEPLSALQALALAGGPDVFAAKRRIQIRRRTEGGEELIVFNYDDVEDGLLLPDAMMLVDGDVIVVPERGIFE